MRAIEYVKGIIGNIIPKVDEFEYGNIYSSRSVVKNGYINEEVTKGYYDEDIWGIVNDELKGKIEPGISLFCEIVGYLASGKAIQKDYDYGCVSYKQPEWREDNTCNCDCGTPCPKGKTGSAPRCTKDELKGHKFLVYRITYTKPNGEVIEFSWQQIKEYCKKYSIEHVKELYFGRIQPVSAGDPFSKIEVPDHASRMDAWFNALQEFYLEKDCPHCKNKVPAEGVIVRIDGKQTYSAYKLKSKRFLLGESKQLDEGQVDVESTIE